MKLDDQALALKTESPTEIAFALTHAIGAMFVLGGAVFGWAATRAYTSKDLLFSLALCLCFGAVGLGLVLYRAELRLDLVARRFRLVRGFLWKLSKVEGGLDEIQELRLLVVRKRLDGRYTTSVVIALSLPGLPDALKLVETGNLEHAHQLFKRLEKALGVRATDETDHAFKPEGEGQWELPEPVQVSARQDRLELEETPRGTLISLPRDSVAGLVFVIAFFGAGFLSMGLLVCAIKLGFVHMKFTESPPGVGWFLGPLFSLIGGAICWGGMFALLGRERAAIEGDQFIFFHEVFGRRFQKRSMAKAEVSHVEIRTSLADDDDRKEKLPLIGGRFQLKRPSLRQEVSIESETAMIRMGSRLTHEELFWLRDYLRKQLTPRMRASG